MLKALLKRNLARRLPDVSRFVHARSCAPAETWPDTMVVSGFFRGSFGIARGAEMTAAALEKNGFSVIRHDVSDLLTSRRLFSHSIEAPSSAGWFLHLNAPEMIAALARLSPLGLPRAIRIAYWAWELATFPEEWAIGGDVVDLIAFPSNFSRAAFEKVKTQQIVLPHPLSLTEGDRWAGAVRTASQSKPYTFMVQMDGLSSIARKNAPAVIEAFRSSFCGSRAARLVVKTQKLNSKQHQALSAHIGESENIDWINREVSASDMGHLLGSIDCLVSAHRSEGFGLALAEAILSEKSVIATGWSGNMDFMHGVPASLINYRLIDVKPTDDVYGRYSALGAQWADPDLDGLAQLMRLQVAGEGCGGREVMHSNLVRNERVWDLIKPGESIQVESFDLINETSSS